MPSLDQLRFSSSRFVWQQVLQTIYSQARHQIKRDNTHSQ
ncbi:hypothetical protein MC7420_6396 [Coleofasciculus chthonoplastes PCC 7420]|uniref:Uncharacterized protein n=1 Tax=Coleofasciculus chthonoplastes PCC 7420 TaxID=118168 RepID=B4VQX5_9CYAN|nr:hypothetical protein MC7420_6396 [Coleofasciculus chthonoplastes PCC 7420]